MFSFGSHLPCMAFLAQKRIQYRVKIKRRRELVKAFYCYNIQIIVKQDNTTNKKPRLISHWVISRGYSLLIRRQINRAFSCRAARSPFASADQYFRRAALSP